ncbi:MAG: hypothetical protein EXR81_03135 [Gammaproteobacteria bacterium]|nr:hypothetical protein [Gammaproteobacteria bacterium]
MTEQQRLLNLLTDKKISEEDFNTLSMALDKRPTRLMTALYLTVNPFQKIAGIKALYLGILVLFLMSALGFYAKTYYVNIMTSIDVGMNPNHQANYTFWLVLYQNIICCLSLSFGYLLFAKLFRQKGLRLIDFFGTVMLARIPFLFDTLTDMAFKTFIPHFFTDPNIFLRPSLLNSIFTLQNLLLGLWAIALYFYALKESSGLTGNKLWIAAIGSFLLATVISSELTMFFV